MYCGCVDSRNTQCFTFLLTLSMASAECLINWQSWMLYSVLAVVFSSSVAQCILLYSVLRVSVMSIWGSARTSTTCLGMNAGADKNGVSSSAELEAVLILLTSECDGNPDFVVDGLILETRAVFNLSVSKFWGDKKASICPRGMDSKDSLLDNSDSRTWARAASWLTTEIIRQ